MKTIFAPALILVCASCGHSEPAQQAASERARPGAPDRLIDCATGGSQTFEHVCTIERQSVSDGQIVTIRAPDGGFRRLLVRRDDQAIVAADGAQPARVGPLRGDTIEVAVGGDRYRLPAKANP